MATINDVRLALIGLNHKKITDEQIQAALDETDVDLSYLRKADVPDNVYDKALINIAAYVVAYRHIVASTVVTVGFSTGGQNTFVKTLGEEAERWRRRVVKKSKSLVSE